MLFSSYTLGRAADDIIKLRERDEIQYNRGRIGCCMRYFLIFPNEQHKYYYNHTKTISNRLFKKVFTYLYTINTMSKRLNKKTTVIPFQNVDIENEEGEDWIAPLKRYRTWVVKEKFGSMQSRFAESQKTQTDGSDVEF